MLAVKGSLMSGCLAVVVVILLASCTHTQNPEKVLNSSLHNMSAKGAYAFQGKTEIIHSGFALSRDASFQGVVLPQNKVYVKDPEARKGNGSQLQQSGTGWRMLEKGQPQALSLQNPLAQVNRLLKMRTGLKVDHSQDSPGYTVLRIDLKGAEMKAEVERQIRGRFSSVREAADTGNPAAQQKITAAGQELNRVLSTLKTSGYALLWVKKATNLPDRLDVVTTNHYTMQGKARTEKMRTTYRFSDYGKKFPIPAS